MRYLRMRLVDGSSGAELWNATTLLALGTIWLTEPPTTGGLLYRVIRFGPASSLLWLLSIIGIAHFIALFRAPTLHAVRCRKVCSVVGVTLWSMSLYQLLLLGQLLTIASLGVLVVLLFVAIGRRRYHEL